MIDIHVKIICQNKRVLTLGQDPRPTDELNPLARPKGITINKTSLEEFETHRK